MDVCASLFISTINSYCVSDIHRLPSVPHSSCFWYGTLIGRHISVIWIGGDLNLPGINWDTLTSDSQRTPAQLSGRFFDMLQSCNLQQMVDFTTRKDNILDLFMSIGHPYYLNANHFLD